MRCNTETDRIQASALRAALLVLALAACGDGSAPSTGGSSSAAGAGGGVGPSAGTPAQPVAASGTGPTAAGQGGVAGALASAGRSGAAGAGAAGSGAAGDAAAGMGGAGGGPSGAGAGGAPAADGGAEPMDGASPSGQNDVWISPQGLDSNPGTEAQPLLGLAEAVGRLIPGGTIWVSAGTYPIAETVSLAAEGAEDKPLRIFALEGERPVFDFAQQPRGESSAAGLRIPGSYWHVRGIDVINAGDNCIHIPGAHNTIERVNTHGCSDTGIQISANSAQADDPTRAANNTVLNCDSHDNYDEANAGENADGFAAKLYIGPGNVFRGCRAWNNADDGWDLFASDDVVVIEDCWAISNGKIGPNQNNTNGDGNGFKLGGAPRAGDQNMGGAPHEVTGSISVENRTCGFVLNNNSQTPRLSMCGGRGDGRSTLCSLTNSGDVPVSMTAAEAIGAKRDADGNLAPIR
jgi:Right handed beta helix region